MSFEPQQEGWQISSPLQEFVETKPIGIADLRGAVEDFIAAVEREARLVIE